MTMWDGLIKRSLILKMYFDLLRGSFFNDKNILEIKYFRRYKIVPQDLIQINVLPAILNKYIRVIKQHEIFV